MAKDKTQNKKEKTKRDSFLFKAFSGKILSSDFIFRNIGYILLGMAMVLVYITNRYECLTCMEEIKKLNKELEIVETERVRVRSLYMSRIRESSMQELVDTMHLNLNVQDRPPYKITIN